MVIENVTLPLDSVISAVQPLFVQLSVLFGGIVGLYIILILVKVYYERKRTKILLDIRSDLERLNKHLKVPPVTKKPHIVKRIFHKVLRK